MATMKDTLMREVLVALNINGAELARELTKLRRDGKVTTAAAVSRWLNGHVQPPLGIWPWLRSRLIQLARSRPPHLGGLRVITVGGGKGGSGTSSICAFLAATAKARGYRFLLGASEASIDGLNYWAKDLLGKFKKPRLVDLSALNSVRAELEGKVDLLIIDAGNKSMLSEADLDRINLGSIDLIVTPCNPTSSLDFHPAEMVARSLTAAGVERFMLVPMIDRMSLSLLMQEPLLPAGLEELSKYMSDAVIFKRWGVQTPKSRLEPTSSAFQDQDLEREYEELLDQVLMRVGVSQELIEMNDEELEGLDIEAILARLQGWKLHHCVAAGLPSCSPLALRAAQGERLRADGHNG